MHLTRKLIVTAALAMALTGCSKNDEQAFSKVDYNKDGKIIFEELIVAFPDLTVEEFLAADADHNGGLDEKEYTRFRDARRAGKKLELPPKTTASAPAPATAPSAAATTETPAAPSPVAQAPSAPTTQIPAGQDTPAQAPTTQTMAMPQTAPDAASADNLSATEEVETVVAQKPAAQKPAAAPKQETPTDAAAATYVVQRGDTLSRIAKKFGVTSKALMEANNLKSADRVDAGATLTIPGKAGQAAQAAPEAVTAFVTDVFAKSDAGDLNALLDQYADSVDYYKKGKSGRDIVRQDKAEFFSRWPKRTYTPGRISLVETTKQGDLRVAVPVAFKAVSGSKTSSGEAVFTFLLRPEGASYKIVGETSVVGKRK